MTYKVSSMYGFLHDIKKTVYSKEALPQKGSFYPDDNSKIKIDHNSIVGCEMSGSPGVCVLQRGSSIENRE